MYVGIVPPVGAKDERPFYPIRWTSVCSCRLPSLAMVSRRALTGALAAFAVAPSTAVAAQIQTDRGCYLERQTGNPVTVTGTGFNPGAPYELLLDGQVIGTGTSDAKGSVVSRFDIGLSRLGARMDEHTYTVTVRQGDITSATRLTLTKFAAGFRPVRGNPKTMRVRFRVVGFGLDPDAPNPDVYLHYVRPDGKHARTIRLGRGIGACGKIRRTRLRRLFPFPAARGDWRLQFDTRRRFTPGTTSSTFTFYTIGVRIRRLA
jgi:hypothetical protein